LLHQYKSTNNEEKAAAAGPSATRSLLLSLPLSLSLTVSLSLYLSLPPSIPAAAAATRSLLRAPHAAGKTGLSRPECFRQRQRERERGGKRERERERERERRGDGESAYVSIRQHTATEADACRYICYTPLAIRLLSYTCSYIRL
jgi:hypothetical protein